MSDVPMSETHGHGEPRNPYRQDAAVPDATGNHPSAAAFVAQEADLRHVWEHICHALRLIDYHDDGLRLPEHREAFSTRLLPAGPGKFLAVVHDARGWEPGRPTQGPGREYEVTITTHAKASEKSTSAPDGPPSGSDRYRRFTESDNPQEKR